MNDYMVKAGTKINLNEWKPDDGRFYSGSKDDAEEILGDLNNRLEELQELLFAEQKRRLLLILQAMDTGGKDGVIRHVFEGVNPQGVRVASFKVPSVLELADDYLWRVHKEVPGNGEIVIFNRSHYEDVLVVRVHNLVPEEVWSKRFEQINNFEKMLVEEGTVILKIFLHIDKDEQKNRFIDRLDTPEKQWKFNPNDLKERERWDDYMKAYEDVLSNTSTRWAPWFIIPSNKKWYRNLVVASILVDKLESLGMQYPGVSFDPNSIKIV